MNYLAHVFLAHETPESMVGNLLADYVRGPLDAYPEGVIAGIHNHRAVDACTDRHPRVVEARSLFTPPLRRYAGIILDVFWDHCLTIRWEDHADEPLAEFANRVYRLLDAYAGELPPAFATLRERLITLDLLLAYRELEGVDRALWRISQRLKRENPLAKGGGPLRLHYDTLLIHFDAFFPDLVNELGPRAGGRY